MIPTKEQFAELISALRRNVNFMYDRLDYRKYSSNDNYSIRRTYLNMMGKNLPSDYDPSNFLYIRHEKFLNEIGKDPFMIGNSELWQILTENELAEFIKVDVNLYLEQSHLVERSIAWIWLHSQQNFIRAREKLRPTKENHENGLEKYIAHKAVQYFESQMKDRQTLITQGITGEKKGRTLKEDDAAKLVKSSPIEIYQSALLHCAREKILYKQWVAGVMLALSNYHYGEAAESAISRKDRVEELISTWELFSEKLLMAELDVELKPFLSNSIKKISMDRGLNELRAIHLSGSLYFINRNDETVCERLFIQEIAILNRKLFHNPPTPISMIADLFYLDGMRSAPTERAIQRITKSAISNLRERNAIGRATFKATVIDGK